MIHPSTLKDEEKILYSRGIELKNNWYNYGKIGFTGFLNTREQNIVKAALGDCCVFSGGFNQAERKICAAFNNAWQLPFPIKAIELKTSKDINLNHRWVLGSVIALGVSRTVIGDIALNNGNCIIVCAEKIEPFLLENFNKVGSYVVKPAKYSLDDIVINQTFKKVTGTISALRLDSLVAMLTNLSRGKSQELFNASSVQKNYKIQERTSTDFNMGDIITIKGFGKFIIEEIGNPTKKGRIPVHCNQYI